MSVSVQIIGSGDAFGSGGRFQTCLLVEDSLGGFAVDFGTSSLIALKGKGIEPADLDMVVVTHLHGDHFGGLPFLLLDRQMRARSEAPLTIAGPPGIASRLHALCDLLFPDVWDKGWRFPLDLIEIEPGKGTELLGRLFNTSPVVHSTGDAQATAVRLWCDDKTIAYSGDSGWTEALIDIADGSDLFLCECYFFDRNPSKHHMNFATLQEIRNRLNTRRLILTHMSDEMLCRLDELDVETAYDGMTIHL